MGRAGFDSKDAARIAKAVRARQRESAIPGIASRRVAQTHNVRAASFAVITTTCTARSGTSPAFTLGQGLGLLLWVTPLGVTSTTGLTVTIYNALEVAIPAATKPVVITFVDGLPTVTLADC